MEVFIFLKMGGSIQRITIVPIDVADSTEARKLFADADVSKCKCFLEEDRQRLLGIVERGFGDFDTFNQMIRQMFQSRFDTQILSLKSNGSLKVESERMPCITEDSIGTDLVQPYKE